MGKQLTNRGLLAALVCAAAVCAAAEPALAAFPGEPGLIAYSKVDVREGEGRAEADGGIFVHGPRAREAPRQLTTDTGDHSPSFSPNGRLIVLVSGDPEGITQDIYLMRSDGSNRRLVTTDGSEPQFLRSGRAIVFVRSVEGRSHIFTVRLDGGGLRQLTAGRHNDTDPAVSPRGRVIAFTSDRDPDGRRDATDLFAMRVDGTRERPLIDGARSEWDADYSPDGRRIVFISNRRGSANVFLARSGGRRVRQLTRCRATPITCPDYEGPVFSPSGRHIAVLELGRRSSDIEVMRSRGRGGPRGEFDSAGTEEEGFGSRLGPLSWGPAT